MRSLTYFLCFSVVTVVACGSSSNGSAVNSDGGATSNDGGTTTTSDGGTTSADGGEASTLPTGLGPYGGYAVGAGQTLGWLKLQSSLPPGTDRVDGVFFPDPLIFTAGCPIQTSGSCVEVGCTGPAGYPLPGAGTISVSGGALSETIPEDNGMGGYGMTFNGAWIAGDTLNVSAAGDAVPAFSTTLTNPQPATFAVAAMPAITITRGQPFTTTWTGGTGSVYVELDVGVSPNASIFCLVPASAGSVTLDGSLTALLPTQSSSSLLVSSEARTVTHAGAWDVTVRAVSNNFLTTEITLN